VAISIFKRNPFNIYEYYHNKLTIKSRRAIIFNNFENHTNFTVIIVNQLRHPFRINVGFLFNQPIGYTREIPFEFPDVTISNEFKFTDFHGTASFNRTHHGMLLFGSFSANTRVTCGRCLEEFDLPLHTDFEEIYTYPGHPLSENETFIPENGFLDLEELIGDFLLLEIPINPICKEDCKGLCSVCGQNMNLVSCGHYSVDPDKEVEAKGTSINKVIP
jgi:uncharacterized protein